MTDLGPRGGAGGHAVIVGGARGLGLAVARAFAGAGWRLSLVDVRPPEGALPAGAAWIGADVRDPAERARALAAAVAAGGAVAALVLCQRFRGPGDDWTGELATSVTASREIVEALAGDLAPGGAVVAIGSAAGEFVAPEQPASYHAAKGALRQLMRYYAVRLGPRGIRCNSVSPGVFVPEAALARGEERYPRQSAATPLGRVPTAEEIARVVLFLAGPGAACVTGQEIAVDGGLSLLAHASLAGGASPAERR